MIHVVLIVTGKVIIDAIPGMTQNVSWTTVNLSYLAVRLLPLDPKAFPACHAIFYSPDCPPALVPHVSLGDGHPLRKRATRWRLRRPNALGTDRRRRTKYALEKMAVLCSCRPVRFPTLSLSPHTHTTTTPKQLSAFHTLHELQPMVVRDQSVSANICTCAQAAYCAFSSSGASLMDADTGF